MAAKKLPTYEAFKHPLLDRPYLLPIGCPDLCESLKFESIPGDVFVCSYPKCGTTWVLNALYMLRNGGKPLEPGENMDNIIPFIEFGGKEMLEGMTERPRIIKTHLYVELLEWNPEAKYIFIARNPKDCFTSFYFHTVGFHELYDFSDGKFEDFFELVMDGDADSGEYFKCVSGWLEQSKTHSNVLFMLYENMKENTEREFLKMVEFIGPEWLEKVMANDGQLLKKIVEGSSFKSMKKQSESFTTSKRLENLPFVRKGIIGDWKNHFTREQSYRVDEKMKEYEKKYQGFSHIWDKYSSYLSF